MINCALPMCCESADSTHFGRLISGYCLDLQVSDCRIQMSGVGLKIYNMSLSLLQGCVPENFKFIFDII
jgi:hypothetical protein